MNECKKLHLIKNSNDSLWNQGITTVCSCVSYSVIDDLYRLRVDSEELVSGAVFWIELKEHAEQRGVRISDWRYERRHFPLLLQTSHVPVLQLSLHPTKHTHFPQLKPILYIRLYIFIYLLANSKGLPVCRCNTVHTWWPVLLVSVRWTFWGQSFALWGSLERQAPLWMLLRCSTV